MVRLFPAPTSALLVAFTALGCLDASALAAQDRDRLTLTDLMQIRQIEDPSITDDGAWIAFTSAPDRGDPEVVLRRIGSDDRVAIPLATDPAFSSDSRWLAARVVPSLEAVETNDEPPRNGVVWMALGDDTRESADEIRAYRFSPDGRWLALHHYAPRDDGDDGDEGEAAVGDGNDGESSPGTLLELVELSTNQRDQLADVRSFSFSDDGGLIAWTVGSADDTRDGVWVRDLGSGTDEQALGLADGSFAGLTWSEPTDELAFLAVEPDQPRSGRVHVWSSDGTGVWVSADDAPEGWIVPENSALEWSEDGAQLYFSWRPLRPDEDVGDESEADVGEAGGSEADEGSNGASAFDAYDPEAILEDRGVDVWHWQDQRIMPQQKVLWNREKDRTYAAVRHRDGGVIALGSPDLPDVRTPGAGAVALATSDLPYRRAATWAGGASDAWLIGLASGERTSVATALSSGPALSPEGRFAIWYDEGHYHLFDVATGSTRTLTGPIGVPFANEDHDYPEPAPGYGVAGWLEDDAAVLLYDKFDIWMVPTDGSEPWSVTNGEGRAERRTFRLIDVDGPIAPDARLLMRSYHDVRKVHGFYEARADRPGVQRLLEDEKRFAFVASADDADRVLFTREAYDEFPDLWVADQNFSDPQKVTDANPGLIDRFAWGSAELLEWQSLDGIPLQGVVIKPGNYVEGRRYPVLVYYYRFMSQRLHEFNDPSVNHRPSFPVYASDDYIVFLPDVRFEVGRPGLSSTKSVVPGVQKLIDVGLADPDRIALHGHSWSGYQTAFMVTQTNMFRTAISGAPVANMTSAYSGIRLGSGLARQFQYEMTQSRIGASPWEALDEYIENSPVFYADRIETPMLILHGDADDAVPWEQSIELFLAMRRLDKEAVLLQYRDEPHHPQTYANKLDWAMKMKEWVDHYLKDAPAPAWISEGIPYRGR